MVSQGWTRFVVYIHSICSLSKNNDFVFYKFTNKLIVDINRE